MKKRTDLKKRLIGIVLCFVMIVTLLPNFTLTAFADGGVLCRVQTVKLSIKDGSTVIASKTIGPSRDFNAYGGYQIIPDISWSPNTLEANKEYTLEISWGAPFAEGYEAGQVFGAVTSVTANDFVEATNSAFDSRRSLDINSTGLNQYGSTGTVKSTFKADNYGAYTMRVAMNHQTGADQRYFDINLIFAASGKEAGFEKTVPAGSNILMETATFYPANKYEITWSKNGTVISGETGTSYMAATAVAGDKYTATIKRKKDDAIGCTGSESWTQSFTVSSEARILPTGRTVTYTGSSFSFSEVIDAGNPGEGFWYGIPVGDFGFLQTLEDYWDDHADEYINAGTYNIRVHVAKANENDFFGTQAGTLTITVLQAKPTLDVAPSAISGLKYTDTAQALVNPGSATNGTLQYSLDHNTWSNAVPTATEAGTYTVYYRVKGANGNYEDLTSDSYKLTVKIAKKEQAAPAAVGKTDETISKKNDGAITGVDDAMEYRAESETSYTAITGNTVEDLAAGKYYVRYKETAECEASADVPVTIAEGRKLNITVPEDPKGYAIILADDQVDYLGSTSFELKVGNGYSGTEDFGVFANDEKLEASGDNIYTLEDIETDMVIRVEGIADITAPSVEIRVLTWRWDSFGDNLIFSLFKKESLDVAIAVSDPASGIGSVEYYLADRVLTLDEVKAITDWETYEGVFRIDPENKYFVYAKATDKAGNVAYVNSEGIVLYSDSILDTDVKDKITYVLTKNAQQSFSLKESENTVAYVEIDDVRLETEDYMALGDMILLSEEVLEELAAGEYIVSVGINPLGETFVGGDEPLEIMIPLIVEKAAVSIDISDSGKVYDGTPVAPVYAIRKSSDSSPAASNVDYNETIEYKLRGADDAAYTKEAPVTAGEYTMRITVAETDKITAATATADFVIEKATYDMSEAKWDYTEPFWYDGSEHEVQVTGLPEGVTVAEYTGVSASEIGTYTAQAALSYDEVNYIAPVMEDLSWEIEFYWVPTENTERVDDVNAENVTPEDKADLESAKEDLEQALEEHGDDYSDADKETIRDDIARIEEALEALEEVEAVEEKIGKLPESITKNDEDAIKAADDAYNALSDYEKSLVDEDAKKTLEDAKAALAKLNKPTDKESPKTMDDHNLWLWFALLLISGATVFGLAVNERKRNMTGKR